jgi:ribosomal protein S18 acetylase RimI-like enzyme
MSSGIVYRLNHASETELARHLNACDADFVPHLSSRVQIVDYAKKLAAKATRFEAWSGDRLVGLVAAYCNDVETRIGHITSVSVCGDWTGKGIAAALMHQCVEHAEKSGMNRINLEVAGNNVAAVALYTKFGFVAGGEKAGMIKMSLELRNGGRHE